MQPAQMYDSAATMFSPDGRIYQVEYAREAVKRGTTAVGVTFADGVVLLVDRRVASRLVEAHMIEKLFKIDAHIGCASSGLVGDARVLVARARMDAQNNRMTYDEPIEIDTLVKTISDIQQVYTQNGGVRPFGAAFLIAGIDSRGVHLYETDPSGAVVAYKATAIGVGRSAALDLLETEFRPGLFQDDAVKLGLKALAKASEGSEQSLSNPDIGIVTRDGGWRKLATEEIARYLPQR